MSALSKPRTEDRPSPRAVVSRIAVGVNGCPEGQDAVALASLLATATASDVMLVAVHPDPLVVLPSEMNWTTLRQQAEGALRQARRGMPGARTLVDCDLSVPRALLRVVKREHRDLLVVGSSQHAHDGHVRIGKRTRQLLGEFSCPVAIASRGLHRRPAPDLSRIVVGYDGTRESTAALELAAALAASANAELSVCSVIDDRTPASLTEQAALVVARTGALSRIEVVGGRPATVLRAAAANADLLVIGSRRWGSVARVLLGSTGEGIAQDAPCSVLVVPCPRTA